MAVRDGMYAVGPHRVRGGRIPATATTVRSEGHPHTEHDAGTWTQGSTKNHTHNNRQCRSWLQDWRRIPLQAGRLGHTPFFFTLSKIHMYNLVCGQELALAPLGGQQGETGHQPTTPTNPPHSVEVNALFCISCISSGSPRLSSGISHCPAEIEPPLRFFTTPTTQGSRGMTEGNARHAAAENTGVRTRLCTIRQRYATQCQWRNHRRRPNPPPADVRCLLLLR